MIELLIAVVIVAILAAVAIPVFLNQRKKAADSVTTQEVEMVADRVSQMVLADSDTSSWTGLGSASGNLTIDGLSQPKNGVLVYANTAAKSWCVSKQSNDSGQVFVSASQSSTSGVYAAVSGCSHAGSAPTAGALSATVLDATGNRLSENQASGSDALGNTTGFTCNANCSLVSSTEQAAGGTRSLKVTKVVEGSYGQVALGGSSSAAGETWTHQAAVYTPVSNPITSIQIYHTNPANVSQSFTPTPGAWTVIQIPHTFAGAATDDFKLTIFGPANSVVYIDNLGRWSGSGGTWSPPGQPVFQ